MLLPAAAGESARKRLLRLFARLAPADQATLLAFAEFLADRKSPEPDEVPPPRPIPRPADESVIQAMRRLATSYAMIDGSRMLNEAASLMAAHVLQGRPATEVIDDLEALYEAAYRQLRDEARSE